MALQEHPEGLREQQDGHLGIRSPIFYEFETVSGAQFCLAPRINNLVFVRAYFQDTFLPMLVLKYGRLAVSMPVFRIDSTATTKFPQKLFSKRSGVEMY